MIAQWLLALLLAYPGGAGAGETPDARLRRLEGLALGLAEAVDLAAMTGAIPARERRLWAAAALATAIRESGLALSVHEGGRLGDGGKSICLMQIHVGNPVAGARAWAALAGTDPAATRRCALAGVWSLLQMRTHCARRVPRSDLLGAALSGYMSGSSCAVSAEGKRRERLTLRLAAFRLAPADVHDRSEQSEREHDDDESSPGRQH